MIGPDASTQDTPTAMTTNPLLGVAGVLLGPLTASTGRLMNVGLADIRWVLHLGVDEGSWTDSALNVSLMGRAAKVLGRRFARSDIRWQSLTAFFFGHISCGMPRGAFPPCPKCQRSIGRSLLHPWRPNEKHIP